MGYSHALIPDADEIIDRELLDHLLSIAENGLAHRVHCQWDCYWHSTDFRITPRQNALPTILVDLEAAHYLMGRNFEGGRAIVLNESFGCLQHLSFVGPTEKMELKFQRLLAQGKAHETWLEGVWRHWETKRTTRGLHPTEPMAYPSACRVAVPESLRTVDCTSFRPADRPRVTLAEGLQRPSIIIPLHGGETEIRNCLTSLAQITDLFHEVIVVDNASPDNAAAIASGFDFVRLEKLPENKGYPAACNIGASLASSPYLLFLNSDVAATRAGLVRLIERIQSSPEIAAVGPYSNCCGHQQQADQFTSSAETAEFWAEEFALEGRADVDVDMLVGFCLLVDAKRFREADGFDEGFGLGTFEDNDLSYKFRRAGTRLVLAGDAFVHHEGSKTMHRMRLDVGSLLNANYRRFAQKWLRDIECGFASHLAGTAPGPIQFCAERNPDEVEAQLKELVQQADISLCMIAKDEERVLDDCLRTASRFFKEIIFVDTGSTDRTKEIAAKYGAKIYDFPWNDSFADARNVSLQHATGKWIFWLDCDDTIPFMCGEEFVKCAIAAEEDVAGFVVPVRFCNEGPVSGVHVDHVKLVRNRPGIHFEGSIHEQIIGSIQGPDMKIARSAGIVLHSGYDTSPEGQARKRTLHLRLLAKDLEERPGHPFILFCYGMTYHCMGEHGQAVDWLRKCLLVSSSAETHVPKAHAMLAGSHYHLGQMDSAMSVIQTGLGTFPEDPELHFMMGQLMFETNRFEEAKAHYRRALSADTSGRFNSFDSGIQGFKAIFNLAESERRSGNYLAARDLFGEVLRTAPQFSQAPVSLFGAAMEYGDFRTAKAMMDRVEALEGRNSRWQQMASQFETALWGK